MGLVAPLGEFNQFVGDRLEVSCKTNPGVFVGHEILASPGADGTMDSAGGGITVNTRLSMIPPPPPGWVGFPDESKASKRAV